MSRRKHMKQITYSEATERWSVWEAVILGRQDGNPFIDFEIKGLFKSKSETVEVNGFYDGEGIYKVRFMPSFLEDYQFKITGSFSDQTYEGRFQVTPATLENHGIMRVANTFHFAYEDGTPYYPVGTTCYVWELQSEELQKQTINTLSEGYFNKIRFCVFPKHYAYNFHDPITFPYEGTPMDSSILKEENFMKYIGSKEGNNWDLSKFNPSYYRNIEVYLTKLMQLGIEADIILLHPYDRWGFSMMDPEQDDLYLKYVVSRFSAYRNVWWSLANEYDLMPHKKISDWERYASLIQRYDSYGHLRSIHNCGAFYDYSRAWITHCCIQRQDVYKCAELVDEYRTRYQKPIVLDEIAYEGNIQYGWGNISGQELVRRFWEATVRGGYAGHGETYLHESNILWWSHGGVLRGESPDRLRFLLQILNETPGIGLTPVTMEWDEHVATTATTIPMKDYFLFYYSFNRPSFRNFYIDDITQYQVDLIDTWEMTVADMGIHNGHFRIPMPGKEYMAVRLKKLK